MDKTLAEFYGTNVPDETDVEKLAAAEAAEVLAGEKGVNLEGMPDDEIEALAQQVLAGETEEKPAEVAEPDAETVAQEKVAEADYLGRVMAHAMVNESKKIQKDELEKAAAAEEAKKKEAAKGGKVMAHLKGKMKKSGAMPPAFMKHMKGKEEEKKEEKKEEKEKKSSTPALDQLVQARALEILEASGIDPEQLTKQSEADPKEVLAQTVETKAWELLKEYGVEPTPEGQE